MEPNILSDVLDRMKVLGYEVLHADNLWFAETKQVLDAAAYEKYESLYDVLLDLDDVQSVFTNADLDD